MKIPFAKMHGLGNDFVVIDGVSCRLPKFSAALIKAVADRRRGIGCDQVLILQKGKNKTADFFYRIYNADGGEVGQCGNGARCAHIFLRRAGLTKKKVLTLQTLTTVLQTKITAGGKVRAVMQKPVFGGAVKIENRIFQLADLGNPHAVCLRGKKKDEKTLLRFAAALNKKFRGGINVGMGTANKKRIALQVHERGSGLTAACGSGALAAACVAIRGGISDNPVRVIMPGGKLLCGVNADGRAWLEGEVSHSFNGVFCWRGGKLAAV